MLDWKEIDGRFGAFSEDTHGEYIVEGDGDACTMHARVRGRSYTRAGMTRAQAFSYAEEIDITAVLG